MIYQYGGVSKKAVRALTVAARDVISTSISFPSSSFRGLFVTTTACEMWDAENFRFNWKVEVDNRDDFGDL